ncbi:hypothetical protein BH23PSE1_BH23PSE1_10020 [soil metagenome]
MSELNLVMLAFVAMNAVRVLAYVPQMVCILRDPSDARAVSFTSWGVFAMSNLATSASAAAAS